MAARRVKNGRISKVSNGIEQTHAKQAKNEDRRYWKKKPPFTPELLLVSQVTG
jgi:hypothetical protein